MYHTVFSISDRYPDAVMCLLALAAVVPVGIVALRQSWRERLWQVPCLGLVCAGMLWLGVFLHGVGGVQGLEFGLVGAAFAVSLAWSVRKGGEITWRGGRKGPEARSLGPFLALGALLLTSGVANPYLASFDLARQASAGRASVVEGTVHDVRSVPGGQGYKPGHECFRVGPDQYCYDNIGSVGFHQTADNGGPIRDGLAVRVTSIGDVIVRLEILDER